MNHKPPVKPDDDSTKRRDAFRLANVSSIGIAMVLCTFIGYGIGNYLDRQFHTMPVWTLVFLLLGIAAGIINIFKTLDKFGK